jgi:hypothetical protein
MLFWVTRSRARRLRPPNSLNVVRSLTVLRSSLTLAVGLPCLAKYLVVDARRVLRAFDRTVVPLTECIEEGKLRRHVGAALRGASVKVGAAVWAYSTLAGVTFDVESVALGGAFTRIYDDLIDHLSDDGDGLDARLADLCEGGAFVPRSQFEALLLGTYQAIERVLHRPSNDPLYVAMRRLHHGSGCSGRPRYGADRVWLGRVPGRPWTVGSTPHR